MPTLKIQELIKEIKSKQSAFFCGAGISFNSGLPVVSLFLNYLFGKLGLTDFEIKLIQNRNLPFESIMEMVMKESGLDEIQEIFTEGEPNANHVFLAKLAKQGYFKILCTTNFDILTEKALENEGLKRDEDFKVYSSEADFNIIPWESEIVKIIKIHGCVTKKEEMAITMSLIASDRYSLMRKDILKNIFEKGVCETVFVLGYSCSDIDIVPLIESFSNNNCLILFVEHQTVLGNSIKELAYEDVSLKLEKNPFKNYQGKRFIINTNEFIENLWTLFLTDEYQISLIPETGWKLNIDRWYFMAEEESGQGVKHHISSRLLYAIGAFTDAIRHNEKAISIARAEKNELAYASEVGNMGMALNALGEYKNARSCFTESIPFCRRIGNLQALSAQLQAFGNVLHHTGEDQIAIDVHKEALYYAQLEKDEYCISNILGNMANSYNRLGEFNNALESLDNALVFSRKLGNKQAESSQLGIISTTYAYQGKYQQALESCTEGIKIKRAIGDRQGECLMLANSINIYKILRRKNEALNAFEDCLKLAREIRNKQVELMIMINKELI